MAFGFYLGDSIQQGAVERRQLFGGRLRLHRGYDDPSAAPKE